MGGGGPGVRDAGRFFFVDAMSSFGAVPVDPEESGIDYLVSSANKCIEGVPGFGFVLARLDRLLATEGMARTLPLDLLGLSEAEVEALAPDERATRLATARRRLLHAGAHFVVESFADCVAVIEVIDQRLQRHERP